MPYISQDAQDRKSCDSCAAPVLRCLTRNRKPTVVNADPDPIGSLTLQSTPEGLKCLFVPPDDRQSDQRYYLSHFATCPNAEQWRQR